MSTSAKTRQHIRYVTAPDGTRLAWAESGAGPVLVKAANWLTHLEYEWESPVWRHWLHFFSAHCRFVRYDERGCGMSDWQDGVLSLEQWAGDLGSVIEAARPDAPVTLLGISQGAGTCIQYALGHPERVGRMILYGGYAQGWRRRGTAESQAVYKAVVDLHARRVGQRQSRVPTNVHVALHSGRQPRAATVVQRSLSEDDARRGRGQDPGSARRYRPHRRPGPRENADARPARAETTR